LAELARRKDSTTASRNSFAERAAGTVATAGEFATDCALAAKEVEGKRVTSAARTNFVENTAKPIAAPQTSNRHRDMAAPLSSPKIHPLDQSPIYRKAMRQATKGNWKPLQQAKRREAVVP
jgi:hypothetical protein